MREWPQNAAFCTIFGAVSSSGNRSSSAWIRLTAMSKYFSSFSMPMNRRPRRTHATPVVPLPMNGSHVPRTGGSYDAPNREIERKRARMLAVYSLRESPYCCQPGRPIPASRSANLENSLVRRNEPGVVPALAPSSIPNDFEPNWQAIEPVQWMVELTTPLEGIPHFVVVKHGTAANADHLLDVLKLP